MPIAPVACVPRIAADTDADERTLRGPEVTWTRSLRENLVEVGGGGGGGGGGVTVPIVTSVLAVAVCPVE